MPSLDQLCACFISCLYGEAGKINVDDHYFIKIEIINLGYLGREIPMLKSIGISSIIILVAAYGPERNRKCKFGSFSTATQ